MASRERDDAMAGLLKRHLAGDAGAGNGCPGPDILAAYFERSLDADETAHVELHLSECARCREQLAALGRAEEAAATPAVQAPRHQPRASWIWDWRWLAPVAAVLVIAAVWATRRPELTRIAEHPAQAPATVATSLPASATDSTCGSESRVTEQAPAFVAAHRARAQCSAGHSASLAGERRRHRFRNGRACRDCGGFAYPQMRWFLSRLRLTSFQRKLRNNKLRQIRRRTHLRPMPPAKA